MYDHAILFASYALSLAVGLFVLILFRFLDEIFNPEAQANKRSVYVSCEDGGMRGRYYKLWQGKPTWAFDSRNSVYTWTVVRAPGCSEDKSFVILMESEFTNAISRMMTYLGYRQHHCHLWSLRPGMLIEVSGVLNSTVELVMNESGHNYKPYDTKSWV